MRTLLFGDLLVQVCCALGLGMLSRSVAGFFGLRWYASAYACATAALVWVLLPGAHGALFLAAPRLLVLVGAVLMTQGLADFVYPKSSVMAWGTGLLIVFGTADVSLALWRAPGAWAIALFGLCFAGQLLVGIWVLLSNEAASERAASRTVAGMLTCLATLFALRAFLLAFAGTRLQQLTALERLEGVGLHIAFSAGMAFGFVWLVAARMRQQLEMEASTDSLTAVLNRRALDLAGQRELARCRRQGSPLAVLAIDLDHFKALNDAHGHAAGDAVLVAAAHCLTQGLRASDLVARFGGEEFIAVLPDRDRDRARMIAERLRSRLEALTVAHEGLQLGVTASLGIAMFEGAGDEWGALLRRADRALYEAKHAGRNRTCGPQATPLRDVVRSAVATG